MASEAKDPQLPHPGLVYREVTARNAPGARTGRGSEAARAVTDAWRVPSSQVDPGNTGRVGPTEAALFLKRSGLPDITLGKVSRRGAGAGDSPAAPVMFVSPHLS